MSKISKINTKYQSAVGPDQARSKFACAGPAAAWYFVFILDTSWKYLAASELNCLLLAAARTYEIVVFSCKCMHIYIHAFM